MVVPIVLAPYPSAANKSFYYSYSVEHQKSYRITPPISPVMYHSVQNEAYVMKKILNRSMK